MSKNSTITGESPLRKALQSNEQMLLHKLEGVQEAHAAHRAAHNCNDMRWVLGHIAYWRNEMITLLGATPAWVDERRSQFRGMSDEPAQPTIGWELAELRAALESTGSRLAALLDDGPAAKQQDPMLRSLLQHETYHIGQLAVLRRLAGI
jgi:hypothetical protein